MFYVLVICLAIVAIFLGWKHGPQFLTTDAGPLIRFAASLSGAVLGLLGLVVVVIIIEEIVGWR
ncbi:MAG: hypothetical protein ACD_67C00019G0002 [uncultured bacterium]|nr:MAG: hypothetical protein ACD_67C00019G0002 [uncultured bacterium]